ncbi:hypothetical protein [Cellulomonas uda]
MLALALVLVIVPGGALPSAPRRGTDVREGPSTMYLDVEITGRPTGVVTA